LWIILSREVEKRFKSSGIKWTGSLVDSESNKLKRRGDTYGGNKTRHQLDDALEER